jgi:hypothetical protein
MKKTLQYILVIVISCIWFFQYPSAFPLVHANSYTNFSYRPIRTPTPTYRHWPKHTPTPIITPTSTPTPVPTVTPTDTPAPSPTPRPIPTGRQSFHTYFGSNSGVIDPYDPSIGSSQNIQLQLSDPKGIVTVNGIVTTDTKTNPFSLSLESGASTNGTWVGSWTVSESYDTVYLMSFEIINAANEISHINLTLR